MIKYIYYFSRTGSSQTLANALGGALHVEVVEIKDTMNWQGFLGYIRAAIASLSKKEVTLTSPIHPIEADEVLVVAPLWASQIANPAIALINAYPKNQILLVAVSNMSELPPHDCQGYKRVYGYITKRQTVAEVVSNIVQDLNPS